MNALLLSGSELLCQQLRAVFAPAGHDLRRCADVKAVSAAERLPRPDVVLLAAPVVPGLVDSLYGALLAAPAAGAHDGEGPPAEGPPGKAPPGKAPPAEGPLAEGPARTNDSDAPPPPLCLLSPDPADADRAQEVGAAFVRLPAAADELLRALQVATRRRKLVLLCDDSALIHRHTGPILREAGFDVAHAHDGAQALVLHEELRPDLVITDIEMPRLDGYGLCQALKARRPHLPVLMCSTLGQAQAVERGFDAGADDYLVKPAPPEDLVARARALLPGRPGGDGGGRRERVLVVDDSQVVRQMVVGALRRQGFAVMSAADGAAGLLRAQRDRPALILTDYDMPHMTGFELVHALRQRPDTRDIPVVMLTARDRRRDERQMRAVGVDGYLVKPFSMDRCAALCERVLAERRQRAYQQASRLYISQAAARAAEEAARSGDPLAVRADEREVAVLFLDVSGFTALSAQREPREVVTILNGVFDELCPVILDEGGDIDKFIGDAIMAVFEDGVGRAAVGPDGAQAGDAAGLRAVRAGLRMQGALSAWRERTGHGLRMRVGINSGRVIRGDIGSRHVRRDYTVIGDVVNRAQRLESSAPVGGVLLGASTYAALSGRVRCDVVRGLRLKGLEGQVDAYLAREILPVDAAFTPPALPAGGGAGDRDGARDDQPERVTEATPGGTEGV